MRFVGRGESPRASAVHRAFLAVIALAIAAVALGACGGGDSGGSGEKQGVVEITCGTICTTSPEPIAKTMAEIAARFNEEYRGRYHIKGFNDPKMRSSGNNDRQAYYQRLALAGDLPDIFNTAPPEAIAVGATGQVMDFGQFFKQDSTWESTFHKDALASYTDQAGHTWGIPFVRDTIGIYWNRAIFRAAGVSEFPRTWDEVNVACEKIKATGKSCFAMDGLWTTLLMWVNLIGTQPGGTDFLAEGIKADDFSNVPPVVKATETLKQWHTEGFTNKDAFTGEYQNAATAFIRGQAAMIANGPWMVGTDIKTKNAIKGLYDNIGYEISPGWTADKPGIVVSSTGAFSSAAKDKRKQEAVVAFAKFVEQHAQSFTIVKRVGQFPAVKFKPTAAEEKTIEPLSLAVNLQSAQAASSYPSAFANAPTSLVTVFPNLWPAYVKGELSTEEFLSKFASDMQSKTG